MIGFNGGLVGIPRDSIGSQSNPGIWTPNEQSLYRGITGKWPTAPVPGDPFPVPYRNLINTFTSTKYYVDAVTGSDLSAGTSSNTAFATIDKAVTTAASGSMIVVYPGVYNNLQITNTSYEGGPLTDRGKVLQIVCAAGQVKITNAALLATYSGRDIPACVLVAGSNVYGAIIERDNGGRTLNYAVGLLRFTRGNMHNCVIRDVSSNGRFSLIYDNSNGYWKLDSCLVIGSTWLSNYAGGTFADFINSASDNASVSIGGNMTNTVTGVTISSSWSVSPPSNGVYSGTYGWYLTTFTYP